MNESNNGKYGRLYHIITMRLSIPSGYLYYLVYNTDSILNDNTIYSNIYGKDSTIASAISSRLNTDSVFRDTYLTVSTMLGAPSIDNSITSRTTSKDRYYRDLAKIHTSYASMVTSAIPIDRDYITIPSMPTTIKCSDLLHYSNMHTIISNRCIDKTITYIDYDSYDRIICPTTNVNNLLVGSEVLSLIKDSRCTRYNDKGIKDIIMPTDILNPTKYIPTLRALRVDSGIGSKSTWLGNSRDYLFIGIVDYDATNYYCIYSSDVCNDSDVYNDIYSTYNTTYGSYHKYAIDTTYPKYLSVFNDSKYIKYAFDIQRGKTDKYHKGVLLPKYEQIHNSYYYDSAYYQYSRDYVPSYMNTTPIQIGKGSIKIDKGTNTFISKVPLFDISTYCTSVIDSMVSASRDSLRYSSNIYHNAINTLRHYMVHNPTDICIAIDAISRQYSKVGSTINEYNIYNMDNNVFNPYEENMHKGYKGITSDKHHYIHKSVLTNYHELKWYLTLRAIYIDGGGGKIPPRPTNNAGRSTPTPTFYSSNRGNNKPYCNIMWYSIDKNTISIILPKRYRYNLNLFDDINTQKVYIFKDGYTTYGKIYKNTICGELSSRMTDGYLQ